MLHLPAYKLPVLGLAQVPEGQTSILANERRGEFGAGRLYSEDKGSINDTMALIHERFPRLKERRKQMAGTLSGGEQQMLAMGRAMMSHPKMLMLDEPSMGLAPLLVEEIFELIKLLNESGTTILLVEQNAQMALSIADRGYVLETGRIVSTADAKELLNDDAVRKAYLGG